MRKLLCRMWTIKVQISLRNRIQTFRTLASLWIWAGQFESYLVQTPKTGFRLTWLIYIMPQNINNIGKAK